MRAERLYALLRGLQLVEREQVVDVGLRLVAVEAGREVGLVVDLLVRQEGLILPLAVADIVRILGAPAGALLHDRVGDQIALGKAAIGVLGRIAIGAELRGVLQDRKSTRLNSSHPS